MKKIEAIIQPFKVDDVKAALTAIGAEGITISEAGPKPINLSGKIGDGKIFVSSIEDAVRIRNGERGESAL